MAKKTGNQAIIEQFLADGMNVMFGNPGTVEQGWLDAMAAYPEMTYIEAMQESVALMMADGYARATKKPTLVQIHSAPGLGNTIGAMYQAMRGHAPLVVIGGDAGIKYMPMEAQMYGDLVAFAEPVTKWSTMVLDHHSLLRTIRRAIKVAATPPMGPVYVCVPADILDKPAVEEVYPTFIPSTRTVPGDNFIEQAAEWLANAKKPMFFIGNGVAYSHAQEEVGRVAELLGAEVYDVDGGDLNLSYAHPLYMGSTGHMFGSHSHSITSQGDVNLVCGTYMVPDVFPKLDNIYAPDAKVIHIDLNAYEIAKNHPVDLGAVADPKLTLAKLADALEASMSNEQKADAKARGEILKNAKEAKLAAQFEADNRVRDEFPMRASRFMEELAAQLPKDVVIVDEALTCSPELHRYIPPTTADQFIQTRGGSLGMAIPGGLGAKLAFPDKTVIALTGDGGSMYTIQALWTAAHHNINAKFVVCNNQSYMLLKLNILEYWKEQEIDPHKFPQPFELVNPVVDFVKIAEAMGVPGIKIERPEQAADGIAQALAHDGPFLIDMVVSNQVPS
ncbi:MAG: thiamine pyrophosphate-binding protein [Ardenticatenaceae bacterium]